MTEDDEAAIIVPMKTIDDDEAAHEDSSISEGDFVHRGNSVHGDASAHVDDVVYEDDPAYEDEFKHTYESASSVGNIFDKLMAASALASKQEHGRASHASSEAESEGGRLP